VRKKLHHTAGNQHCRQYVDIVVSKGLSSLKLTRHSKQRSSTAAVLCKASVIIQQQLVQRQTASSQSVSGLIPRMQYCSYAVLVQGCRLQQCMNESAVHWRTLPASFLCIDVA
jgi:hypothetical protein